MVKYKQCCYCGADTGGNQYSCGTRDGEGDAPAIRSELCTRVGWNPPKVLAMRVIVLAELRRYMDELGGRLPAYVCCKEDDYIREPDQLDGMTDSQLLDVLVASCAFAG